LSLRLSAAVKLVYDGQGGYSGLLWRWLVSLHRSGKVDLLKENSYAIKWERLPSGTLWPYVVTFGWCQDQQDEQEPATLPKKK
jgi:hypothetical protein